MSSPRVILFVCSFLLWSAACATPEGVTIADELFPGAVARDRGPLLLRLVDDLTGEPLAGAEVFQVAESKTPIAGEFWWTRRGHSDDAGFVRMERPKGDRDWSVLVVRHPRCGVAAASVRGIHVMRCGRGFDVPVRITDWLGRPQPGAGIGFCGGCGHTPDLANATAGADGVAVLRGVDVHQDIADLYVQHPGLSIFYRGVDWRPGDPPAEVACGYAPAQLGRVLNHRGEAVPGALVDGGVIHRGPWARTATDGTFTILGAGQRPDRVVVGGREIWFASAVGVRVTLRLPDLADEDAYQGTAEPSHRSVPPPVPVQWREVVVDGVPPGEASCYSWFVGKEEVAAFATAVQVPIGAPFELSMVVGTKERSSNRAWLFPDGAPGDGELRVRWLPDPNVRGQCVDAAGVPCVGRVRWVNDEAHEVATDPDGRFVFASREGGWRVLEVCAATGDAWRRHHVRMGDAGSADVELGALRVAGRAPLVVVDAGGEPLRDAKVGFVRAGWNEPGEPWGAPLQADGGWCGVVLRAGDGIVVERDGHVPFRTVLAGDGPWAIVVPDGELELEVAAANGDPIDAVVVFGDHAVDAKGGAVQLRGLPHGPLRAFVSAPGHRSAIVDVVVGPEPRTVRVELPWR